MAYCMNCGQQLPEGAKFCSSCGTATGEVKTETAQRKTVYDGELGCVSKPKSTQVSCVPLAKCAQIWHNIANPNKGVAQYGKTI